MKKLFAAGLLTWVASTCVGCRQEPPVTFEPNMVFAKAIEIDTGYPMQQALAETQVALTKLFGTPDAPLLPEVVTSDEEYAGLISPENLQKAAGAPVAAGVGLYRQHCSTCHGVVGNGRGTTAALLDPYPRDYRMGKYKFKDTTRSAKPTRSDIAYSIKNGVVGTAMKPIPELTDSDIEALVDYVIYLSWRGELERALLMEGSDIAFEEGAHLYMEGSEGFEEQREIVNETVLEIGDSWLAAEERVKEVPEPVDVPVPATIEELRTAMLAPGDSAIKQSVAKGQEIFQSETAACIKCHGKEGHGDGPQIDYDDWTKDWTLRIGIDPLDEAAQVPLVARGALPPRKITPRNFREGLFRGGSEPEHIFRRIAVGIDGTPMPAATLPEQDIWHLVNYVRSLAEPVSTEPVSTEPAPTEPAPTEPAPR